MKIKVQNLYSTSTKVFQGEAEEIRAQLHEAYPWLARYGGESLTDELATLGRQQALMVEVE